MELIYIKEFNFIPKLQLSKSRRAVYYSYSDHLNGKLPKRFYIKGIPIKNILLSDCEWKERNLFNKETKEFVIKNTKSVGKPKYFVINGQPFYNSILVRNVRNGLVVKLHEYFKELIKDVPILEKNDDERFRLALEFYIPEDFTGPDYDNLWLFEKIINDVLHKDLKVIEDDNHKFMTGGSKDYVYNEEEGFKLEIWKMKKRIKKNESSIN